MGVPTLTLAMPRGMYGRNGEMVLKSVGLEQWVAGSAGEYLEKAVTLAADLRGLAALRQGLRHTFLSSPLCAADRFSRHLEDAFRGMVRAGTPHAPV